jgi:hypothetical protein
MRFTAGGGDASWGLRCVGGQLSLLSGSTASSPAVWSPGLPLRVNLVASLRHVAEPHALVVQVRACGHCDRGIRNEAQLS